MDTAEIISIEKTQKQWTQESGKDRVQWVKTEFLFVRGSETVTLNLNAIYSFQW